ncbi:MAG: YbaK/EbsC family protein [bacterium]|nr:YbaK/EbsC family protein [bacterium]
MSLIKVKEHLKQYGIENRIVELDESSASVKEAAHALHTTEAAIAKSIAMMIDNEPSIIVLAGDMKLDNHKFKEEFHVKAKMLPFEETEEIVGHAPGGVCPFGVNENVKIYLDESLKAHDFVYPACGSSNSAIKLSLGELEKISKPVKWVNVGKGKDE